MKDRWRKLARPRVALGGAFAVLVVGVVCADSGIRTADAAGPIPSFPDNIVVFPDRDFVSVEGYSEYGGQVATIQVLRPGVGVVGSAKATVSGTDVAFEINHPGGQCWGAGTGLNVTPDIRPGDEVTMIIGGSEVGTTTVLDAQAFDAQLVPPATVIVQGHIGLGVDPAQLEQRIVEPALRDTSVAKRDVRATLGPLTPGPSGYDSSLEVTGTTFTATYVFTGPDAATAAEIAANAGLGERALAWQLTDADANRQGLTIAENGEPGGPGMGGCPNGPLQSGPPAPTNVTATRGDGSSSINVTWTPAVAPPGTPPILGYEVIAIDAEVNGGEQITIGRRIDGATANHTTINGLVGSHLYDIEIVSVSSVGRTFPAVHTTPSPDGTPPTITASVPGGSYPVPQLVSLIADEPLVDIYYTLDGSDPVDSSGVTASAIAYIGPIPITGTTTLTYAGFDRSNNVSSVVSQTYTITNDPTAAKTSILSVTPALESVDIAWAAADPVAPATTITDYLVRVYDAADAAIPFKTQNSNGNILSMHVAGLTGNTDYWYTVAAKNDINSAWGPESDRFGPVAPQGSIVANAGPDQTNVVRSTLVTLTGAGSTVGFGTITYQWTQMTDAAGTAVMPAGPNRVTLSNAASLNATFTMPLYNATMSLSPLFFRLSVSDGTSTRTDMVTIAPRNDTVTVASARWKAGDFRVTGTGAIEGATITVRATINGVTSTVGTAQVTAGAWTLRLRNAAAPAVRPTVVFAVSNQGALVGPVTVTN